MRALAGIVLLSLASALFAQSNEEFLDSPRRAIIEADRLSAADQAKSAVDLLRQAADRYPRDTEVLSAYAELLFRMERYGAAEKIFKRILELRDNRPAQERLAEINEKYEQYTRNINFATIVMQKNTDAGNYDTTIAVGDRAIAKFPDNAVLYNAKGEAQYRKGELEAAEVTFRRALQIDPFNKEARSYVEEIRTTEQAQTSTELAEWISIAKDKVGDFIVTFLALFAAFLTNSLVAPIILRIKLNRARRLFERGNYDEFTDLLEGLLDEENFAPLRANFRFMLRHKSFEEANEILHKYHNTPERLPSLQRILERENEKLLQST